MKARRQSPAQAPSVSEQADKLSHVQRMVHDEDERPSREDMDYGNTIFTRPAVPLPRFLRGGKKRGSR
jgi:hypothetical protein